MMANLHFGAAFVGVLAVIAMPASAQQFPTKPIEIIVPFVPGGSTDLSARITAKALQDRWKVPMRIVNKPGGNTVPGVDEVMRSPADGYKVLWDTDSSASIMDVFMSDLPFKVMDRTWIGIVTEAPLVLAVAQDSPIKSFQEAVDFVRKDPTIVTWTSLGGSSSADIAMRRFFKAAGVDPTRTRPVMSRGGAEGAVQVAGGHVMLGTGTYSSYSTMIPTKKVRVLAAFAPQRLKGLPDVPTSKELGLPNTETSLFNGFSGPANMPAEVVARYEAGIQKILKDPKVVEELERVGLEAKFSDSRKMKVYVENDIKVVRELFGK
jgi:tripartite-type tricarboxylate transporter receptor subunit TctC